VGCSGEIAYTTYEYDGTAEATLIVVNGRAEYTDQYDHWLNYLYSRPWNVVMWDHFGQGRSEGPRAHADDFDLQHVRDMGAVIEQLSDPALPLVSASHSTGGLVTIRYIQQKPGALHLELDRADVFRATYEFLDAALVE
jgi:acylglycerol lipase